jgi:hypothetical protein
VAAHSIKHGATSIWERWNGWTPETGFGDPGTRNGKTGARRFEGKKIPEMFLPLNFLARQTRLPC